MPFEQSFQLFTNVYMFYDVVSCWCDRKNNSLSSIYFTNTTWSYYSRLCSLAYLLSKFTLKLRFIIFRQWRPRTLVLLRNNGLDQKRRGITQAGFGLKDRHELWRRHDFILTLFWLFKYFLESLSNLLSKGSGITSISVWSQPQSLIYYRVLFSHGVASPYFGPMGRVSSWVQFGRVLELEHDPSTLVVILPLLYNF
jgi:hypothetical protein